MAQFVFIEGADGIGKSSVVYELVHYRCGYIPVTQLSFPTDRLRDTIESGSPTAEQFLSDISAELVRVAEEPRLVICDRSFVSTMAYQAIDWEDVVKFLPEVVLEKPMMVVNLYLSPEQIKKRLVSRSRNVGVGYNDNPNNLLEHLTSVQERYSHTIEDLKRAWSSDPDKLVYNVSASGSTEEIAAAITDCVNEWALPAGEEE